MRSVPGEMIRADEHHVAEVAIDERETAKDERAHEDLAELGVRLHDLQQVLAIELDHVAGLRHSRRDEALPPREHVRFASELAGRVHRDDGLHALLRAEDLNLAAHDDEEARVHHACLDQHITALNGVRHAMRGDARDLRGRERRKGVVHRRHRWLAQRRHGAHVPLGLQHHFERKSVTRAMVASGFSSMIQ